MMMILAAQLRQFLIVASSQPLPSIGNGCERKYLPIKSSQQPLRL